MHRPDHRTLSFPSFAAGAVVLTWLACSSVVAQQPTFTPIGFLDPALPFSTASSVSDDGSVVAGAGFVTGHWPIMWTKEVGIEPLGVLEGNWNQGAAHSVSANGSVMVGTNTVNCCGWVRSVRWINAGEPEYLGSNLADAPIDDMNHTDTAQKVSGDGLTVVGQSRTGCTNCFNFAHPYRWTEAEGMVSLIPVDQAESYMGAAKAVSYDGSVIAGFVMISGTGNQRAFRWTADGGIEVFGPTNAISDAFGVSPDGSVIVGSLYIIGTTAVGAFRWTESEGLQNLGSHVYNEVEQNTRARSTNADGSTIVGYITTIDFPGGPLTYHAMIWDEAHGVRLLQDALQQNYGLTLPGWQLTDARHITPDGQFIVGEGINPQGNTEGWIIELPPSQPGIPGDLNGDGSVGVPDLLILLANWGPCPKQGPCPADLNGSGSVGVVDLLILLANWG